MESCRKPEPSEPATHSKHTKILTAVVTEKKQAVRVATQYAPAPLLPVGAQTPRAPPSRRNVPVLSHAEYFPTLTTAAVLRVKAALSKAA